ncbi:Phage shock protein PspC (stress-responsive transcriptional regulator) [Microbacterium pygmaeum]|uniref:Phage shock protein PspC (Stress-responsive transcriptional regulator) n=2 Tax=Microbacterium pygmaeum TaxID=370764 RepID=A0A1G7TQG8_9MICO|nr:Phage shock protein PspC (stress-responsive transcriptional regulator) [Microbacterium pygmaeum]
MHMSRLERPRRQRLVAGVCSALAARYDTSVTALRIVMVLGAVFFGLSFWIYLALWILIPAEG